MILSKEKFEKLQLPVGVFGRFVPMGIEIVNFDGKPCNEKGEVEAGDEPTEEDILRDKKNVLAMELELLRQEKVALLEAIAKSTPEAPKPEAPKPEAPKPEAPKPEAPK